MPFAWLFNSIYTLTNTRVYWSAVRKQVARAYNDTVWWYLIHVSKYMNVFSATQQQPIAYYYHNKRNTDVHSKQCVQTKCAR